MTHNTVSDRLRTTSIVVNDDLLPNSTSIMKHSGIDGNGQVCQSDTGWSATVSNAAD